MIFFNKILLFLGGFLLFFADSVLGQGSINSDYEKFAKSFLSTIHYPSHLVNNCEPMMCLIKIEVNSAKQVTDVDLSDSADSLISKEFEQNKQKLDIHSLEKFIVAGFINNTTTTYLIPFFYSLYQMPCPPQNIKFIKLNNYYKYNGKQLDGNVTILSPFNYKIKIQE